MGKKKVKSSAKWKATSLIIADHFQIIASKLINRANDTELVSDTIARLMDVKALVTESDEITIVTAENLDTDKNSIVASITAVENNSTAVLSTILMRLEHESKPFQLEQVVDEYKPVPEKLVNNINGFFSENKTASFVEFTHGGRTYRVTMREYGVYELMAHSKKGNWEVRAMFKGLRG
jgi:hypothetical protein